MANLGATASATRTTGAGTVPATSWTAGGCATADERRQQSALTDLTIFWSQQSWPPTGAMVSVGQGQARSVTPISETP